jgi:hypothetical protein
MSNEKPTILVLCTGNSCRSHLGEGLLRAAAGDLFNVVSAGSKPAGYVHPLAIVAMKDGAHLGSDTIVSKLSVRWQKIFLVIGHGLMLFICWLLFKGSLDQTIINWDSTSAVMEASMGIFYACGMVLAVSGALILVDHLMRLMRGELADSELIGVRESEEEPIDVPAPLK